LERQITWELLRADLPRREGIIRFAQLLILIAEHLKLAPSQDPGRLTGMCGRPSSDTGAILTPGSLAACRAVVFDMDGVIVDSEPLHEQAFLDVFDELGYANRHGIHFPSYYGRSDEALWRDFIAAHQPPHSFAELMDRKRTRLINLLRRDQPIFEGLPDLVEKLAARFPLALASGSPHPVIDEVLAMRGMHRFFKTVVSVTDVAHPKPAPDVFLRAAELLGMDPAACCVVEDSAVGVTAACQAGMASIAITNSLPAAQLAHATRVVETYEEIEILLLAPGA
jgi:beta-phosphoglucomutase-like phosphatase (HAD superfamily)